MSDKPSVVEVSTAGPNYLGWRGELLAELALARLPGLVVHKKPGRQPSDLPYDFLVVAPNGFCFFVTVRAYSSLRLGIPDVESVPELSWVVDAETIRRARTARNPVLLFLFDADTDHGRYLRLDTLPAPATGSPRYTIRIPLGHTITREGLEQLIAALQNTKISPPAQ